VEHDAVIQHPLAVVHELVAATREAGIPLALARVEIGTLQARTEGDRPCRGIADGHALGEDLLHPGVGREGFALLNPNRGKLADQLGVEGIAWFVLNHRVQLMPEAVVVGMDGVDLRT